MEDSATPQLELSNDPKPEAPAIATIKPMKTPAMLPAIRIRSKSQFGHLHITIVIDAKADRELEVFAQLGRAGELTYSDIEGMCRLASLYLRAGGLLDDIVHQLIGIGSTLSSDTAKVSIANSLGEAPNRYLEFKMKFGMKALLFGEVEIPEE